MLRLHNCPEPLTQRTFRNDDNDDDDSYLTFTEHVPFLPDAISIF